MVLGTEPGGDPSAESRQRGRLIVLGSANVDLVLGVRALPSPGETVMGGVPSRGFGGKGANQAVAAARDGGLVSFIGAVGGDADGHAIARQLTRERIDVSRLRRLGHATTGLAVVIVASDGENSIVVVPGANAELTRLSQDDLDCVAGAAVLLLQLETPLAAASAAARAARGLVILNAAPAMQLPDELLSAVDVLVVNESEAAAQPAAVAQVPVVVTTLGADGVLLHRDGLPDLHVPGRAVAAVDTTGAGDTFCGVLAAALASGRPWPTALHRANAAASLSVQRRGAQNSLPTAAEIDIALSHAADQ
jgi:ribokinase